MKGFAGGKEGSRSDRKVEYSMRPAEDGDYWYCYQLHRRNMLELFTRHWGRYISTEFRKGFDPKKVTILLVGERKIGYFSLREQDEGLYLEDIQLCHSVHGRGIGTSVLNMIIQESPSKSVGLTTFTDNPALRLYKRLGFVVTEQEQGTLRMMRRND